MQVTVNGERRALEADSSLAQLLAELKLAGRPVAVEVNRVLVPREKHSEHRLAEGDIIEIVALVGGG